MNDIIVLKKPKSKALTNAERSQRARDKKKNNKLVTLNTTLNVMASTQYNQLIESGHDINEIIAYAHNQAPLKEYPL